MMISVKSSALLIEKIQRGSRTCFKNLTISYKKFVDLKLVQNMTNKAFIIATLILLLICQQNLNWTGVRKN